jgi:hypothetical protein
LDSQLDVAAPELERRGLRASFYVTDDQDGLPVAPGDTIRITERFFQGWRRIGPGEPIRTPFRS